MPLLEHHIAVVTGAGSGIGRAIASGYAREGAQVALVDINATAAEEAAQEIRDAGGQAASFALDVTRREDCIAAARRIAAQVGPVSILVNNAGINRRNPFTGEAAAVIKDWEDILSVNLNGVFNVTHAFLEQLRSTKGRVVNIGSVQSFVHMRTPNSIAYTTSKHGVLGLTRALAAELGKHGGARQRPRSDEDLHGPHAARTPRQTGRHRGPGDLPCLRSLILRDGIDRDGGRRLQGDLRCASLQEAQLPQLSILC
jgi:NAD(P)-dependent dehydrogenase (short-subunit alcohol dehydrogenase family)